MRNRAWLVVPAVVAAAGFGLVVWQSIRTITGTPLGTLGAVLLYVGLGLFLVALVLVAVLSRQEPGAPEPEPAPAPAPAPPAAL